MNSRVLGSCPQVCPLEASIDWDTRMPVGSKNDRWSVPPACDVHKTVECASTGVISIGTSSPCLFARETRGLPNPTEAFIVSGSVGILPDCEPFDPSSDYGMAAVFRPRLCWHSRLVMGTTHSGSLPCKNHFKIRRI